MIKLRFSSFGAALANENRHPQKVMKELGISYTTAIPQPVADQWLFLDCQNIPEKLPEYLDDITKRGL